MTRQPKEYIFHSDYWFLEFLETIFSSNIVHIYFKWRENYEMCKILVQSRLIIK